MIIKFKRTRPEDVFASFINPQIKYDRTGAMHTPNEWGNYPSGNEFIDLFAGLVHKHGMRTLQQYARMMGADYQLFTPTFTMLTGMKPREWVHQYLDLAARELLEKTDMKINKIAKRLGFSEFGFRYYFHSMHECTPTDWRERKKKERYDW